jgi:gluconate 2-dehydrogenase gamma chain
MANQSPDRRRVLEMMAKAAVASQFPGFSRWMFAQSSVAPQATSYQRQFYSPGEYQTISVLTELIIPKDESPGAQEAGVSEFIDFMAAHGEEELKPMREGLRQLDNTARKAHGAGFLELRPEQQAAVLRGMQQTSFFRLIRSYTVMGYYTSRIGLEELDYPGLKLYSHSPECPHKDDPEHRHLPAARF